MSTRNLIRDRFLGAAVGGYYLESSVLKHGIQRGHFHTACRMLSSLQDGARARPGARLLRGDAGQRRWRHARTP